MDGSQMVRARRLSKEMKELEFAMSQGQINSEEAYKKMANLKMQKQVEDMEKKSDAMLDMVRKVREEEQQKIRERELKQLEEA